MASAITSTSEFRTQMVENLEDAVSRELMTQAVTLVPCGHVFNEDTIDCLGRHKLCPNDRIPIKRYIPNYTIRNLAAAALAHPEERAPTREEEPTEEASTHFAKAKVMSDQGNYEAAISSLLLALQISPHFHKAQAYLDFCLNHATAEESISFSVDSSFKSQSDKDKYTDLLFDLLEDPQIKQEISLQEILGEAVENLIESSAHKLTSEEESQYKWTQRLFREDGKVRTFVVEKLQAIHGKTACPLIAFGKAKWLQYFGVIREEPPLPPDIHRILESPCPFWPDKTVQETHTLVLIPRTVNGKPFNLNALERLIQHPKQGHATRYRSHGWDKLKAEFGDQSPYASYWILMTKDVLPGSTLKTRSSQFQLVDSYSKKAQVPYQVPSALESATSILLEYVQSGTWRIPFTCTRCQEIVKEGPICVGNYCPSFGSYQSTPDDLYLGNFSGNDVDSSVGVAPLRKF